MSRFWPRKQGDEQLNIHIQSGKVLQQQQTTWIAPTQDLFIENGKIAGIGQAPAGFVAQKVIDARNKLVMPGLINSHTHAYMSVFRNYADDLSFEDWLFGKIMPAEDALEPEDAYWCNLLSCLEMIGTGTTCFLDMHMFAGQSVRAVQESGLRAVISRGLVGKSPQDPAATLRLNQAFEEMEAAKGNDNIRFMLAPHAIYSCRGPLLEYLGELAREKGLGLHIHVAESQNEFDNCLKEHGCSPVKYLDSLHVFQAPTVAAHCVHLTEEDMEILAERGVSVATNPVSNMKLGNGFAPVPSLMEKGVNLCVGTDGASSNNVLNMFRELSVLALIHKGAEKKAQCISAGEALQMGTRNGAKALGLEHLTGSVEVGKAADLVLLDLTKPWLQPVNDIPASLIYSANGAEVDTVLVDGRILLERGEYKTLDEERIRAEMERIRRKYLR